MSKNKRKHKPSETAAVRDRSGEAERDEEEGKPQKRFWRDWEPVVKFNFIIALSTVVYVLVTGGLLWIANNELTESHRAFVYAKSAEILVSRDEWVVHLINSGDTPARNVLIYSTMCSWLRGRGAPNELPDDFSFSNLGLPPTPQFIGPHGTAETSFPAPPIEELLRGERNLYLYGSVEYSDVFGTRHTTDYCVFLTGLSISKEYGVLNEFQQCPKHNCDDGSCPKVWGYNDGVCVKPPQPK